MDISTVMMVSAETVTNATGMFSCYNIKEGYHFPCKTKGCCGSKEDLLCCDELDKAVDKILLYGGLALLGIVLLVVAVVILCCFCKRRDDQNTVIVNTQPPPPAPLPQYGGAPMPQYGGASSPQYGGAPMPQFGGAPYPSAGGQSRY